MKKPHSTISLILISILVLYCNSIVIAQTTKTDSNLSSADIIELRPIIDSRIALYAKYLLEGDSVSIAGMYASDGMMGCTQGEKIISKAGEWIRSDIENDSRHLTFKTITLNADGDLLIETGTAEARSDAGELKYTFRYLVVWKKEDGVWKLYRDFGL
ncbi:MAG: nuclear transport factor 2 family protein [Ignavibacteriaceae bacterium]|nr:nuclear transport factor 2 family protein [Ignavibacteriaceae bacterium]